MDFKGKSVSTKKELSYSMLTREPIELSSRPCLPREQGDAIDEVLNAYDVHISKDCFNALVSASMRSVHGFAFTMLRAVIASLKDSDSPDITPLKCLLLERILGLNYLTLEDIAQRCNTSKQNAHTQLKRMIARMSDYATDAQESFDLMLFVTALSDIAPKN